MAAAARVHLVDITDPSERIPEGMLFAIGEIRLRPVHAAVFGGEADGLTPKAVWPPATRVGATRAARPATFGPVPGGAVRSGHV